MPNQVATTWSALLPVIVAGIFPVVAVLSPKATVIVLVVAGLSGIGLAVRQGAWRELLPPIPASLLAFAMGWMLVKSLTTFDGQFTVGLWLRLAALMLCGFGTLWLFRTLPSHAKRQVHDALIAGVIVALILLWLIFAVLRFGGFDLLGAGRPDPLSALSPGQMIIAMVSVLAWGVLWARRRWALAAGLFVATLALYLPMSSNIAVVALIAGGLGMVWGRGLQGPGATALAAILATTVLATPIVASSLTARFANDPVPAATTGPFRVTSGLDRSIRHRLQIWRFVAARAQERPYAGWGLDASRRIPGGNRATSLGEERLPLHPHNGILQVWLELGLPGLVILALIVGYVTAAPRSSRDPPLAHAVRAGTVLAVFTIAGLAFGIWQNWWISSIWLTAALVTTFPARVGQRESGQPVRVLINGLHARSGGGVTYLRNIVPFLARDPELDVHLCIHEDQAAVVSGMGDDVTVHVLSFKAGFWRLLVREQLDIPALADRIGAEVTFSPANFGPIFAPNPVILLRNALGVSFLERRPRKIAYWALLSLATAVSLLAARAAIAVSEYAKQSLAGGVLRPLRDKITVIPHGVSGLFSPPGGDFVRDRFLLAVSDIYVQKNFKNLVLAFAEICGSHPDVVLKVAGAPIDQELYEELQQIVAREGLEERVTFLGTVSPKALAELYRRCAVFVFPSRVETFGNPLVEAMASGAPIASSRATAMPEVLGQAAVYFNPENVDDMAAVLDRLLSDPGLRSELGKRAVVRARDYSWERTADRTGAVIRRAAGLG